MPEYTIATVAAVVIVVAVELLWARTGLFRSPQYWLAMLIVFAFQVLVDGWLTRLPDPIVAYEPGQFSGVRAPLDIPVEDFGFGFALVTATLIAWKVTGQAAIKAAGPGRPQP